MPQSVFVTELESVAGPHRHRRLIANLRKHLLSDAAAIVGHAAILLDEASAKDYPAEIQDDLRQLHDTAKDLYVFIKEQTTPNWPILKQADFEQQMQRLRHDILNRLNHPQSYCQLLLTRDSEEYFGAMMDDLQAVQATCNSCSATLARYKTMDAVQADRDSTASADGLPAPAVPADVWRPAQELLAESAVMVVDDKPENLELLARFLEGEGHKVTTTTDGREALAMLHEQEYDLVLLDLVMPEISGYQVLRRMRDDERLRHTPVIMISGVTEVDHVVACIEMGADDHLPKPVDFKLLRARLNSCLERKRLREREFGQFFTPELARHFVRHPELLKQPRDAEVTVLFCDIRGFSSISERLSPAKTVNWLSDVMAMLSECVLAHRGVLVDYVGDELMAMWGAPERQENHAELACRAALDMLRCLPSVDQRWQAVIGESTRVGIGIDTGEARVGNTGSDRKFKYGPLGHTVNLASRVQGANKYLGTKMLITGRTRSKLGADFPARRLCQVRVQNIQHPVELFELCPAAKFVSSKSRENYELALTEFESRHLTEAAALLGQLLVDQPGDGPSLLLISRVVNMLLDRTAEFDPVWDLPGK